MMEAKKQLCSLLSSIPKAENGTTIHGSKISFRFQIHRNQVNSLDLPATPSTPRAMVLQAKSLSKPWQESPSQMLMLVVADSGEITELLPSQINYHSHRLQVMMHTRELTKKKYHPKLVLSRLSSGSWSTEKVIMPYTGTSRMDQPLKSPQASDCGTTRTTLHHHPRLMLRHSLTNWLTLDSKSHSLMSSCLMRLKVKQEGLERQKWKSQVPLLLLLWVLQLLPLFSSPETGSTIFSSNEFIRNG